MGFKEAMQEYGKEITASFRCYDVTEEGSVDENSYVEYGDDSIVSMRFHYEGALLKSVMRCLDVEVKRDANSNIGINSFLKNVRFGVKAPGDADYSYKEYGTYIVKDMKIDEEQDTILLECYDLMLMSMVPYDLPYNDGRFTLNDFLWDICARFGWERGFDGEEYANKNFRLEENNLYDESFTFRDVLDDIAEATASIVAFVGDTLTLIQPTYKGVYFDTSNLKSLKTGEEYGPINSVVLSRSPQEDNIYKRDEDSVAANGLTEIRIENNQIIDHNRDGALYPIYIVLVGWKYALYDLESFGIGCIDLGDLFDFRTPDGEYHRTIMLCDDLLINQGVTEKCYLEAPAATETDYKAASTTDRMLNQTVLKVNKQEQTITGLVSKTQALDNSVNGLNGTVTKMSEILMDEEKVSVKITEAINGIDSVETSTGYTFDKDGLRIAKSDSPMENLLDNTGMYVNRDNEIILQANQDGVEALNLTSKQFLIVGDNSRFENYDNGTGSRRTACFYIGG